MESGGEHELDRALINQMIDVARNAARQAYVPYSDFPVGACVLAADGSLVSGVNIENASYGLTVCGERVAMFRAAADGHREIRAVAVSATRATGVTPCGACRQVLNEFKPKDGDMTVIIDHGDERDPERVRLSTLLPRAFGPSDLERQE
jgi:cytidine deaminase